MIRVSSLPETEIAYLHQLTQQAIGRVAERAWFVLLSNQGKTVSQICQLFQRGPNCVRKWIKRYQAYGSRKLTVSVGFMTYHEQEGQKA